MTKSIPTLLAGALCLVLGACGDEPSSSDLEQAFRGVFARMSPPQVAVANLQLGGKPDGKVDDPTDIANFREVGCALAAPKDGYACQFTVTLNGIDRPKIRANFSKAADGKLAMED